MLGTATQPLASLNVDERRAYRRSKPISALPQPHRPTNMSSQAVWADIFAGMALLASAIGVAGTIAWVGCDLFSQLSSIPLSSLPRVLSGVL